MRHSATIFALILSCVLLGACAGSGNTLRPNASRAYPKELTRRGTLPIQVIRHVTHIELTNTTARSFGPSTIWINGRFSMPIDGLAIGQTLRLDLREFRDEFGDTFRAGGFFATRDPDALVLAELENDDAMYGLIVVGSLMD